MHYFKNKYIIWLFVISLVVNIFLGSLFFINQKAASPKTVNKLNPADFPYLASRIFYDNSKDRLINFVPLRIKLLNYIKDTNKEIGIYFEYLPSGVSIGINEKNGFYLASLLKTPLVMAVYRQVENGKVDLNKELTVEQKHIDSGYGNLWEKGVGTKLTVKKAIDLALMESDNTAYLLLYYLLEPKAKDLFSDIFDNLNIPREKYNTLPIVTPKNYSSILRSLYFSSYLSLESSNKILTDLTNTKFNDQIIAGVPSNIRVSHKIGVYENESGASIYSDCGIVYEPRRPYIVCIMTKDLTNQEANLRIKNLSSMIYNYVSSVNYK